MATRKAQRRRSGNTDIIAILEKIAKNVVQVAQSIENKFDALEKNKQYTINSTRLSQMKPNQVDGCILGVFGGNQAISY